MKTFTTRDTLNQWTQGEHTPRSRAAWEAGVRHAVVGREPDLYRDSPADYRRAYLDGYDTTRVRLAAGEGWLCGECRAVHVSDASGAPASLPLPTPESDRDREEQG